MYLVPIHVPIYRAGERSLVTTEWKRSLLLLRDSLQGRFGELVVAAPSLPADAAADQKLEAMSDDDGVRLEPSFDARVRARAFWLKHRRQWLAHLRPLIAQADVVHTGLDDIYRPISYAAFPLARRLGRPTVFVQDTDIVLQTQESARAGGRLSGLKKRAYATVYDRVFRGGVAGADLSLLKGRALMERYAAGARNPKKFEDTSYLASEIVPRSLIDARLATLRTDRPLRFVYCGRLVERKGVADSLTVLAEARKRGANIWFDVIGAGPQLDDLKARAARVGLGDAVRFLGPLPYGPELLRRLAEYDALFFTPPIEDTPRMIFDGYAAGLPLISTDINYAQERADEDGAAVLLPRAHPEVAPRVLHDLDLRRETLAELTEKAYAAAEYHAADRWYSRRAEWTFEIADRQRAHTSITVPA